MTGAVETVVVEDEVPIDESCLTGAERAVAAAMRAPTAGVRHRRSRALARHLVAPVLGVEPAAVVLAGGRCEPLRVDHPHGPTIAVAHAAGVVAVALRARGRVGVDVEAADRTRRVSDAVATDARCAALRSLVPDGLVPLATWVVLEAALKAAGTGFSYPQREATVAVAGTGVTVAVGSYGTYGVAVRATRGTVVAVATPGVVPSVTWHDRPPARGVTSAVLRTPVRHTGGGVTAVARPPGAPRPARSSSGPSPSPSRARA